MSEKLEKVLEDLNFNKYEKDGSRFFNIFKDFSRKEDKYPNYYKIFLNFDKKTIKAYLIWSKENGSWDDKLFREKNENKLFKVINEYLKGNCINTNILNKINEIRNRLENR